MGSSRWDGHQLVIASRNEAVRMLAALVEHVLGRDEKLLIAAASIRPGIDDLVDDLRVYGIDAAAAVERGQLQVVDDVRFYTDYEALVEQALREGHRGVRSFGGPEAAAAILRPAEFKEFERMLQTLWTSRGVTSVCRYPARALETEAELAHAFARHSSGWRQQILHGHRPEPGLLCLHGDVDTSNDRVLAAMLTEATRPAETNLIVDCANVTHMSASGWRTLMASTRPVRERGGRVVLRSPSPIMVRILHALGLAGTFELAADLPRVRDER